jgi:c-di-GMP-binding flagellar brake protein YcgR
MEKGELYVERRKHKRVEKKFNVVYKLISAEEEQEIKQGIIKRTGESADISLGGVRVYGELTGKVGDIIRIQIFVNDNSEPITTFAEIKWIDSSSADKKVFGLEFLILKDSDKEVLSNIIGE